MKEITKIETTDTAMLRSVIEHSLGNSSTQLTFTLIVSRPYTLIDE